MAIDYRFCEGGDSPAVRFIISRTALYNDLFNPDGNVLAGETTGQPYVIDCPKDRRDIERFIVKHVRLYKNAGKTLCDIRVTAIGRPEHEPRSLMPCEGNPSPNLIGKVLQSPAFAVNTWEMSMATGYPPPNLSL